MKFREIDYTMFEDKDIEKLTAKKDKVSSNNILLEKFRAYLKN